MSSDLTPPEVRVLRELTDEWQPTRFIDGGRGQRVLSVLVSLGLAERTASECTRRYRLTDAGREYLEAAELW